MATFDYVAWGNSTIGKWVLEDGSSGVYRGQCTQTVTQFLKDFGYPGWQAARGNGSQVGATMVARGEAVYVGTNLAKVPSGEIHVICQEVGTGRAGHVSMAGASDIVFEQNVSTGSVIRNYGVGPTYPGRIGRLAEPWRMTRYHYKVIVDGNFDDIGDGDGGADDPDDGAQGPNQLRYLKGRVINTKKSKNNRLNAIEDHKDYHIVNITRHDPGQDI